MRRARSAIRASWVNIRWVRLDEARELPLPTITGLILGEIGRLVQEPP